MRCGSTLMPGDLQRPVMISGTITDASGRTLSGQTAEAFWNSVAHARPISVGFNCALGAEALRPYVQELARVAGISVSVHPNAGLPNEFGGYDDTPGYMAGRLAEFAESGIVNIVGGCCGTTPRHIGAIAEAVADLPPRVRPDVEPRCRLSGLEPLTVGPLTGFVNIGERTNVAGSAKFAKLIREGDYAAGIEIARQQVENGAQLIDVNMDEAMLDSEVAVETFLRLVAAEPYISRVPVMIDSSRWSVIETGLKNVQGKGVVNSVSLKEGEQAFIEQAEEILRYGAAVVVMAFDETGQADSCERMVEILTRSYKILAEEVGFPAVGHHSRSQHLPHRHRNGGTRQLLGGLRRSHAHDQENPASRPGFGGGQQHVLLVPGQQRRSRGHALGIPVPRAGSRHGYGNRQRRPARGLRGHSGNSPGACRGRSTEPAAGRDGTAARGGGQRSEPAQEPGSRSLVAGRFGRGAVVPRPGRRDQRFRRRGHRGSAPRRGPSPRRHRGSLDGRYEHRR